ncbi:DUF1697 domain-containing protein [Gimesia algae]|uniref:DUF1697 domain-containing protein n=1 Tax=Gimesia algae TaxID=2527971 RepID=A0A517VGW7_9PLAN|nr:DUF1697 domain-containing protein [Gimesia algae]QDT92225.1 hypothetical protein Pan161_38920 [Gimesia algae]
MKETSVNTFIALLRGINVGGNNRLPMKELTTLLEELGYQSIQTYIQSGNVIFQSRKKQTVKMVKEISARIGETQGFEPHILLLEKGDLQSAIDHNPFPVNDGKALHFFFLDSVPRKPDLEKLQALQVKSERFHLQDKVFYLHAPDGIGRSKLAAKVESCLGVPVTARNWNTVSKLDSMIQESH